MLISRRMFLNRASLALLAIVYRNPAQAFDATILKSITITNAKYSIENDGFTDRPSISFLVTNNSKAAISRIFLVGKVQSPDRSVPWLEDSFNYPIPGGIEPGEAKELKLAPNMFSAWGQVPPDAAKTAVLTLTLKAIDDASGAHIGE